MKMRSGRHREQGSMNGNNKDRNQHQHNTKRRRRIEASAVAPHIHPLILSSLIIGIVCLIGEGYWLGAVQGAETVSSSVDLNAATIADTDTTIDLVVTVTSPPDMTPFEDLDGEQPDLSIPTYTSQQQQQQTDVVPVRIWNYWFNAKIDTRLFRKTASSDGSIVREMIFDDLGEDVEFMANVGDILEVVNQVTSKVLERAVVKDGLDYKQTPIWIGPEQLVRSVRENEEIKARQQQLEQDMSVIVEPWTDIVRNVMTKEDCQKIIDAAEAVGFPDDIDSIDANDEVVRKASWSIDVYESKMLHFPSIEVLYRPYLSKLQDIVRSKKVQLANNDTIPSLDWVFVRKYSADNPRKDLKLHHDINSMSVNIALNDDFDGGGYFYVKPPLKFFYQDADGDWTPNDFQRIPNLPEYLQSYEFLQEHDRYSDILEFPQVSTGDLFIHNYTVWHGIAPLERGTRYSLLMFYDMDHPDVVDFLSEEVQVRIWNYYHDAEIPIRLERLDKTRQTITRDVVMNECEEDIFLTAISGEEYEVVNRVTGKVLETFEIEKGNDYHADPIWIGPDDVIAHIRAELDDDTDETEDEGGDERHDVTEGNDEL